MSTFLVLFLLSRFCQTRTIASTQATQIFVLSSFQTKQNKTKQSRSIESNQKKKKKKKMNEKAILMNALAIKRFDSIRFLSCIASHCIQFVFDLNNARMILEILGMCVFGALHPYKQLAIFRHFFCEVFGEVFGKFL